MMQTLPKWWRIVCLAHTVIAVVFGLGFILMPDIIMDMLGWNVVDPYVDRMMGAALIAMAWAHWKSSKQTSSEKISILIQMYLIFDVLGTAFSLWVSIAYAMVTGWLLTGIFGFFMVAYAIIILKK